MGLDVWDEQARGVLEALERSRSNPADLVPVKRLRERTQERVDVAATPWEQGYPAARRLRCDLDIDGQTLTTFEELSAALGVDRSLLGAASAATTPGCHIIP